jgi:ribosomal protein S18 acetylase RimI-like enzyme
MQPIHYRKGTPEDDSAITIHFYKLWIDNNVTPENLRPDWKEATLTFITQARASLNYQSFIAEVESSIIGSVGCQQFTGLCPIPFQPNFRKDGYIWGVYVEPHYRQQGIGKALTQLSIDYLQDIGCTRAVLNASPSGKPVYEQLGFQPHNAMMLELRNNFS